MKRNSKIRWGLLALLLPVYAYSQEIALVDLPKEKIDRHIRVYQLYTDTLFDSKQQVTILSLPTKKAHLYAPRLVHSRELKPTSRLALENRAIAAINGGFFNMKEGGSVTYYESEGRAIYYNSTNEKQWAFENNIFNGAIVIAHSGTLSIEPARDDDFYANSPHEQGVLVSGPLLISAGKKSTLAEVNFVTRRHPRTCLCMTNEALLLIAIDGRREEANGMSLPEVQELVSRLGCKDAINLDGGGSTTLWGDGKILNHPSGKTGERSVANALLLLYSPD